MEPNPKQEDADGRENRPVGILSLRFTACEAQRARLQDVHARVGRIG